MDPAALETDRSGRLTRAFVAVDVPDGHRAALAAFLRSCAELAPAFRWAPPANLHVTVRFCGGLDESALTRLREALRAIRGDRFRAALGEVGTFGGPRRPRVVWLSLTAGAEPLTALAAAVEDACRAAGLEPEERPFRAHLTLARAAGREPAALPALPAPPALEPWGVDRFVLYESRLGRGPAVYVPLEEFPLSPGR